jgi:hypothetical protein
MQYFLKSCHFLISQCKDFANYHDLSVISPFNPLTPNDPYRGLTAPLTYKRCILYICSTNIGTEYFKRGINSPFFPLQNAVCFIILTYLVPILFTFYIQGVLKLKKKSGAKRLISEAELLPHNHTQKQGLSCLFFFFQEARNYISFCCAALCII